MGFSSAQVWLLIYLTIGLLPAQVTPIRLEKPQEDHQPTSSQNTACHVRDRSYVSVPVLWVIRERSAGFDLRVEIPQAERCLFSIGLAFDLVIVSVVTTSCFSNGLTFSTANKVIILKISCNHVCVVTAS
jgi:hypothetical protein